MNTQVTEGGFDVVNYILSQTPRKSEFGSGCIHVFKRGLRMGLSCNELCEPGQNRCERCLRIESLEQIILPISPIPISREKATTTTSSVSSSHIMCRPRTSTFTGPTVAILGGVDLHPPLILLLSSLFLLFPRRLLLRNPPAQMSGRRNQKPRKANLPAVSVWNEPWRQSANHVITHVCVLRVLERCLNWNVLNVRLT